MLTADPQIRDSAVKAVHHQFRIVGAGPTGALLALGLAQQGFSVVLHDRLSAELLLNRSRAYAITHSSRRLLQGLGLWAGLLDQLEPFRTLRLDDCSAHRTAWFNVRDLRPGNRSSEAIGWILDHRPLMHLLLERLEASDQVVLQLNDAKPAEEALTTAGPCQWIVAADGPRSTLRRCAEVPFWSHAYQQGCLTAKLRLTGADQLCAYELFRPEGPMAVLPLGQDRYQVVWSAPLQRCRDRAASSSAELLSALNEILPDGLNAVQLLDDPGAFPLELSLAPRLHRDSLLLVGEAGHRCHPVGGQGLNLCWRDVSDLLHLTEAMRCGEMAFPSLARRYSRCRRFDLAGVLLATDLLIRFFSNHNPLLMPFRRLALFMLKHVSWIRRLSLSAMTDGPGALLKPLPK
ncbi:2-octaprenyl-6-methoxyphenyl hydroxylase [Synechococcus sp. BIOS-E4-1]|nr:2-octaprenyl-6-methoxyphenyl hydroxylase [Synechococcus sp. BIOS-E4-1]